MTQHAFLASSPNLGASRSTTPSSTIYTPLSSQASIASTHLPPRAPPSRRPSPLNLGARGTRRSTGVAATAFHSNSTSASASVSSTEPMAERPPMHRPTDGRSGLPLLKDERGRPSYDSPAGSARPVLRRARHSTFSSRSPDFEAQTATRRKYTYAAFFLALSLVSFVVQTETAIYIQHDLGWNKAYCMLYLTHGSWSLLWPFQLLVLRIQKRQVPWAAFWRRHVFLLRSTAQMVETQDVHVGARSSNKSPVPYMLRTTAFITTFLTIAGGSWYVAVDLTSPSDLTAIYNCSAFFAYAFSIPLLGDRLRLDKVFSVAVAVGGVLIVAYGDKGDGSEKEEEIKNRTLGNVIIGIGSVLYGLYEVLYKRFACPPEGTSPGRGMIFAMTFGSLIGTFTLTVLWIPLPLLHWLGWETFALPRGQAAWLLAISVLANAVFSGSFLVLMSLTSPVLSSVAALLTIFLVAIVEQILPQHKPLSAAALFGGLLIISAFLLLSWSTYREMTEERRKRLESEDVVSESDEESLLDGQPISS